MKEEPTREEIISALKDIIDEAENLRELVNLYREDLSYSDIEEPNSVKVARGILKRLWEAI